MPLVIPGHWVWDFWFARDGADWHIFFLRAPKSLVDPDRRHRNATIGHARSPDLRTWELLPDPFGVGKRGDWDDLALWTGSCVRAGDTWWMFYTGVSTADDGNIQRIGAATSRDLVTWDKHPDNPLCTSDARWYETYDPTAWYEEAWRDPCVFPDPDGARFHMFITARTATGPADRRGAIGHATSHDLVSWDVQPPVGTPETFGHMEVSQHMAIEGRHYALFCVPEEMQPGIIPDERWTGTGYLMADDLAGPYVPGPTPFVFADRAGTTYAGKVVDMDGDLLFVATLHQTPQGRGYVGTIADPVPLEVRPDGGIVAHGPVG
jgi:beta-fructofuranosidase